MLASTVQFSKYGESPHIPHRQTPRHPGRYDEHEALQRSQPSTPPKQQSRPVPSGPNSVPTTSSPRTTTFQTTASTDTTDVLAATPGHRPNWSAFHPRAPSPTPAGAPIMERRSRSVHGSGPHPRGVRPVLLRKEVIQPHL